MPAQCLGLQLVSQLGTSFSMLAIAGTFWWQRNCFLCLNIDNMYNIMHLPLIKFNSIRCFRCCFFVPQVSVLLSSAVPFLPFHFPSRPSSGSSLQRPSPSSSTFPFFDGSINFSRSVCGTHWLHWATLLLKHKLISCSHPPSINHRPSTCSPLHPRLLLFPTQISLLPPLPILPPHILHLSLLTCTRALTCGRVHVGTPLGLARGAWWPNVQGCWELEAEEAGIEDRKLWGLEASAERSRAASRRAAHRKIEELFSCHIKMHQPSTMGLCADSGGSPIVRANNQTSIKLLPRTTFSSPSYRHHQRRGWEKERRGRHKFCWNLTNAFTSSSGSFTFHFSSLS